MEADGKMTEAAAAKADAMEKASSVYHAERATSSAAEKKPKEQPNPLQQLLCCAGRK